MWFNTNRDQFYFIEFAVRSLYALERRPGMISLLAGKPNPTTFPFLSLEVNARSGEDSSKDISYVLEGQELEDGLQYGDTAGLPALLEWFYGLQELSHSKVRGEGNWSITMGNGAQDLIYKIVNAILNPGDAILVESPVYACAFHLNQCDDAMTLSDLWFGKIAASYLCLQHSNANK
jgi:tryptophan aminotransferase